MGWLKVKRGADMSRELCLPSLFDVFMSKTSFLPGAVGSRQLKNNNNSNAPLAPF